MKDKFTWSEITFGKHEGKTLPQIVLSDPDWFFWALRQKVFRSPLAAEAKDIAYKICHIKIPRPNPEDWKFEFICNSDGKLLDLRLLRAEHAVYGHLHRQVMGLLDMSWPRLWGGYGKSSCKLLLAAIRHYYFGGSRLTRARCEAFFSNNANFVWEGQNLFDIEFQNQGIPPY
jgi:hypothetical protein